MRFYKNPEWEEEYKNRYKHYRTHLELLFPDIFNWQLDKEQMKEMARCEIEVMMLDAKIGNAMPDYPAKPDLIHRREVRKDLFTYRKNLLLTLESRMAVHFRMKRLEGKQPEIATKKTARQQMESLFSNEDLTE